MIMNFCPECNCHDHAASCFFNPYVYAATGNVSGGVCDDCMHNTEGRQCEFCKLGFYQDPALDLRHPEICKRESNQDFYYKLCKFAQVQINSLIIW